VLATHHHATKELMSLIMLLTSWEAWRGDWYSAIRVVELHWRAWAYVFERLQILGEQGLYYHQRLISQCSCACILEQTGGVLLGLELLVRCKGGLLRTP